MVALDGFGMAKIDVPWKVAEGIVMTGYAVVMLYFIGGGWYALQRAPENSASEFGATFGLSIGITMFLVAVWWVNNHYGIVGVE